MIIKQRLRELDVRLLPTLVTAAKQEDELRSESRVVEPIPGPDIDSQLTYASADRLAVARIPSRQTREPNRDGRPRDRIPKRGKPGSHEVAAIPGDVASQFHR